VKAKLDGWANLLIGWGYTAVFTLLIAHIPYNKPPVLEILLISLAVYLFINLVAKSRAVTWLLLGASAAGAAVVTFVCWVDTPISKPVLYIVEGVLDLWYCITYSFPVKYPQMLVFAQISTIIAAIVASIVVVLLYLRYFSFYLMTGCSLALAIFSWIMSGKENRLLFGVLCTLTILAYIRHVYKSRSKLGLVPEGLPLGTMLVYTLPLALLPVIIISFIPKNNYPIQWPWLDQKIMQAINYYEQRYKTIDMDFFSLASTGFSGGSKRLGGPVRPNNVIVMEVKADRRTYLRGAAYSWYENNTWIQTANLDWYLNQSIDYMNQHEDFSKSWPNIPVEKLFSYASEEDRELLTNLAAGNLTDILFSNDSLEIKYRNMTTQTVFMPLKTIFPIHNMDDSTMSIVQDLHGIAKSQEKLPTNSSYKLDYIQPMYGEPLLKKALTFSYKGLYAQAANILAEEVNSLRERYRYSQWRSSSYVIDQENALFERINILDELSSQAANIRHEYTQLSPDTPQRIRELAFEITKDCKNDYERVVAIEQYLRNHYTYNLNTSYVPENMDFVDYFLFEDPQGYCTYFATAMNVLLRCLNIPSRYVEGYVLPEQATNGIYVVSNRYAHAWVEVYFEGFGWLIFEPTAVYANSMNYRVSNEVLSAAAYNIPTLEEMMARYRGYADSSDYLPMTPITDVEAAPANNALKAVPWILAGLVVLTVLVNYALMLIGGLRMKGYGSGKKVMKCFALMLKWLSHLGYQMKPGETIREFSERMDQLFILSRTKFKDVAPVFVKVCYGGRPVSAEEVQKVESLFNDLKKAVLKDLGIKRYIPIRYMIMGL
jgi:transglutaminase-like putative cysteine protease